MPEAERVLGLLKRHGWDATSFKNLEPGFRYRFDPSGDGCIGFVDTGSAWVAAAAPIVAEERLRASAARFAAEARQAGRRVCFFGVEARFHAVTSLGIIRIGEQPVWDPTAWADTVSATRSIRAQLRRAANKGVVVRPLEPGELRQNSPRRRHLERLIANWLGRRRLPPMGFLVQVRPFSYPEERRYFAAERNGRVVGLLTADPIYARGGWMVDNLIRDTEAPNGTADLLVDIAMRTAAVAGSRYVTLGLAPLIGPTSMWLRAARVLGQPFYNFKGLHAFKSRLRPDRWDPLYVAFPPGQSPALTIYDILRAFAGERLWRFGAQAVRLGLGRATG